MEKKRWDVAELRRLYPKFIFEAYHVEEKAEHFLIRYDFSIPGLSAFNPSWEIPKPLVPALDLTSPQGGAFVFSLGLVELLSYWKCACPPVVELRCGYLDEAQKEFWSRLYCGGLGEFLHINHIDIPHDELFRFVCDVTPHAPDSEWHPTSAELTRPRLEERALLIPVGGGKDSVVTLERLRALGARRWAYAVNPSQAALACMAEAGIAPEQRILPRRSLDQRLLALNARGFLNGHTPFSALLAFSAALVARLFALDDIVLSNEASADEASVPDSEINHQYSKSSAFELDFAAYLRRYLAPELRYFSFLRPFSELAIAQDFARYRAYFPLFRSCNVGSKSQSWCGRCAKCLFVACVLLPFVGLDTVENILGKDIFSDAGLAETLDGLCGLAKEKPFECVGTVEELNLALTLYIDQVQAEGRTGEDFSGLPYLLKRYALRRGLGRRASDGQSAAGSDALENPLNRRYPAPLLPAEYEPYLKDFLASPCGDEGAWGTKAEG